MLLVVSSSGSQIVRSNGHFFSGAMDHLIILRGPFVIRGLQFKNHKPKGEYGRPKGECGRPKGECGHKGECGPKGECGYPV